jgi:hypothetical protein
VDVDNWAHEDGPNAHNAARQFIPLWISTILPVAAFRSRSNDRTETSLPTVHLPRREADRHSTSPAGTIYAPVSETASPRQSSPPAPVESFIFFSNPFRLTSSQLRRSGMCRTPEFEAHGDPDAAEEPSQAGRKRMCLWLVVAFRGALYAGRLTLQKCAPLRSFVSFLPNGQSGVRNR